MPVQIDAIDEGSDGYRRLTGSDIDAVLRDPSEEAIAPSI